MITSKELYKRLLLKVNLNDTNGNVHIPKSVFVLTFNEIAEVWLAEYVDKNENTDKINDVSEFLIPDTELTKAGDYKDSTDFTLPEDFLRISRSYSLATKGECSDRVIVNWDIKNKNINTILTNSNESPSFEYEETPAKAANNKLKVYKSDFTINKVFLDYYKIPTKIDIEGYVDFDGVKSTNINADFSSWAANQIISRTALALTRNSQNTEGVQFAKDRVLTEG